MKNSKVTFQPIVSADHILWAESLWDKTLCVSFCPVHCLASHNAGLMQLIKPRAGFTNEKTLVTDTLIANP